MPAMIALPVFLRFSNIYGKGESKQVKYHKIQKLSSELINKRALDNRKSMSGLVFQKESLRLQIFEAHKGHSSCTDRMGEVDKASCTGHSRFSLFLNNHQKSVSTLSTT